MALTNAEKQAAWRARRKAAGKPADWKTQRIAELEAEVERLKRVGPRKSIPTLMMERNEALPRPQWANDPARYISNIALEIASHLGSPDINLPTTPAERELLDLAGGAEYLKAVRGYWRLGKREQRKRDAPPPPGYRYVVTDADEAQPPVMP